MRRFQKVLVSKKRLVVVLALALFAMLTAGGLVFAHAVWQREQAKAAEKSNTLQVAGQNPSESAKMICADETRAHVRAILGVDTVSDPAASWNSASHIYRCNYHYSGDPQITLSVKELSSTAQTTAYFTSLGSQVGKAKDQTIGQGAFSTIDGSVVVRKDYKVLLVDVSHLPEQFPPSDAGTSSYQRGYIARAVAEAILNCWNGD